MDNAYNIARIFNELELEIISNMNATMKHHLKEEEIEGFSWSQWQSEFLLGFSEYKKKNKEVLDKYTNIINSAIDESIKLAYQNGMNKQQIQILKALKKGYKIDKRKREPITGSFFKLNEKKLNALIDSSTKDLKKAEGRILRYTNDVYRQIPYKAQFFASTGATTTWKAVDMAVEEFLKLGINNIEYANGTRVNIASYAEMCIRTANKRAYLTGEGQMRERWGVHTVLVSSHASACPRCQQWQGRVYIDDVWSGGSVEEAKELGYPLLSSAMNGGLYHPNCKDTHTTYFPGINTEPKEQTKYQLKESSRRYNLEQKQRYYERQVRKYARLEEGSLDIDNERYYRDKKNRWHDKYKNHVEDNKDILREAPERIKTRGLYEKVAESDIIKEKDYIESVKILGFTGEVNIRPETIDVSEFLFDEKHINKDRKHNVTREEAEQFIKDAKVTITRWKGRFVNFYGDEGSAYVDVQNNVIKTAYKKQEYDDKTKKLIKKRNDLNE